MPTYDYECGACKKRLEIFHSISETKKKCPHCGANKLQRLLGAGAGFLFKGSGFYITDYRNPDYKSKAKADSESQKPPESKPEKKDSKKSDSSKDK